MRKLTDKEESFCTHIAAGLPAYEAALEAGYAEKSCKSFKYKWKKRPMLVFRVQQLRNDHGHINELSDLDLTKSEDRRVGLAILAQSSDTSVAAKLKALDLLNKMDGVYQHEQNSDIRVQLIQPEFVDESESPRELKAFGPPPKPLPFPEYKNELLD